MKLLYIALFLAMAIPLPSCKKYIQKQEENAVLQVMTTGVWYVQEYLQNDTDITATFSGYLFKFDANGTVTGTAGSLIVNGTWAADINNYTITADFPTVGAPLKELNETWKITDSYTNFVVANSKDTTQNTSNILQLQKQ